MPKHSPTKGKLPAFPFYARDWLTDPALLMCSRQARSVWIDMLCLAFFASTRGVCATGERPWSNQEIAAALPGDIGTNMECIAELLRKEWHREILGAPYSRAGWFATTRNAGQLRNG
jgi:hypothetical protein